MTERMSAPASAIAAIFKPRTVALFGASEAAGSIGTVMLRNLLGSFQGKVYAVNPKHETVQGIKSYRHIRQIRARVDCAVIVTPAPTIPEIVAACGEQGIRAAIIVSAGFREAGETGKRLERELLKVARRYGIRFLGPNCLGVMRPELGFNATFSAGDATQGHIALVSQSGALCTSILDWAQVSGVGFSSVISTGISADVDFGEILDFLVSDPRTASIMLYVEGIHDARRFMSALRAAARAKPVIVMKAGRHAEGSRAAFSHTGALVGADDVFDAALRRAGVLRVTNFANLFAAATTLQVGVRTPGSRLAIVTNGGGPAVMAADYLADKGLPLAELSPATLTKLDGTLPAAWSRANPVDVLGDTPAEQYGEAVEACLADPGVDAVLTILTPQAMTHPHAVAEGVVAIAGRARKPIFTCWMGETSVASSRELFRDHDVPTYRTPEAAVESFAAVAAYHDNQQLLVQVPEPLTRRSHAPDLQGARMIIEDALGQRRKVLNLAESKAVLSAFHVPIVQSLPARTAAEALLIAEEIGFPVALKIHSSDISHKTDVGGVRLGITTAQELRSACHEMIERVKALRPEAHIDGVLVERMWRRPNGRELMIGVISDPVFGPVISFGLGGNMVEVLRDRAVALPPLNRYLARSLIANTRAADYLAEFRGMPAANQEAIEDMLLRVSEMVCELPWLREMDINPLVADEDGVVAVDARIVVARRKPVEEDYAHMSIHPYPTRLVRQWELADGTPIVIRPIRPEDAVIERDFVNALSQQSKYFRFMYALDEITPEMLSRFTQIDYDREMALVAVVEQDGEERQIAVARYATYPDGQTCEFAVVVADEWQGRGVASQLLKSLIDAAREKRLQRMEGIVLRQNRNMLKLAQQLGFEQNQDEQDASIMSLVLEL